MFPAIIESRIATAIKDPLTFLVTPINVARKRFNLRSEHHQRARSLAMAALTPEQVQGLSRQLEAAPIQRRAVVAERRHPMIFEALQTSTLAKVAETYGISRGRAHQIYSDIKRLAALQDRTVARVVKVVLREAQEAGPAPKDGPGSRGAV
jgi:cytochrome P450